MLVGKPRSIFFKELSNCYQEEHRPSEMLKKLLFSQWRTETTSLPDSELLHPVITVCAARRSCSTVSALELAAIFTRSKIIARDISLRLFLVVFLLFPYYANCPACPIILIFMPACWCLPTGNHTQHGYHTVAWYRELLEDGLGMPSW